MAVAVPILLFVSLAVAVLLLPLPMTYVAHWLSLTSFDANRWKADLGVRQSMVRSLLREHDLKALTYEQLVDLLGPSDRLPGEADGYPDWDLEYFLGPGPGLLPNYEFLLIRVKPGERATAVAIKRANLDL